MRIILASASPRRRELLSQIGLDFEVIVSEVEEKVGAMLPEQVVEELSARKAEAVLGAIGDSAEDVLVIGADTVVALDGQILGKPGSPQEAAEMLRRLSGRNHGVYTGVALLYRPGSAGSRDVPGRPCPQRVPWTAAPCSARFSTRGRMWRSSPWRRRRLPFMWPPATVWTRRGLMASRECLPDT